MQSKHLEDVGSLTNLRKELTVRRSRNEAARRDAEDRSKYELVDILDLIEHRLNVAGMTGSGDLLGRLYIARMSDKCETVLRFRAAQDISRANLEDILDWFEEQLDEYIEETK